MNNISLFEYMKQNEYLNIFNSDHKIQQQTLEECFIEVLIANMPEFFTKYFKNIILVKDKYCTFQKIIDYRIFFETFFYEKNNFYIMLGHPAYILTKKTICSLLQSKNYIFSMEEGYDENEKQNLFSKNIMSLLNVIFKSSIFGINEKISSIIFRNYLKYFRNKLNNSNMLNKLDSIIIRYGANQFTCRAYSSLIDCFDNFSSFPVDTISSKFITPIYIKYKSYFLNIELIEFLIYEIIFNDIFMLRHRHLPDHQKLNLVRGMYENYFSKYVENYIESIYEFERFKTHFLNLIYKNIYNYGILF